MNVISQVKFKNGYLKTILYTILVQNSVLVARPHPCFHPIHNVMLDKKSLKQEDLVKQSIYLTLILSQKKAATERSHSG